MGIACTLMRNERELTRWRGVVAEAGPTLDVEKVAWKGQLGRAFMLRGQELSSARLSTLSMEQEQLQQQQQHSTVPP